jgi:hypothetical protein
MNGLQVMATLCYVQEKMTPYYRGSADLMHYALQAAKELFPMYFYTSSKDVQ